MQMHHAKSVLVAALMSAFSSWGGAATVSQLGSKTSGEVTRLVLESPVGMLQDATLTRMGTMLQLRLKDAEKDDLQKHLQKLASETKWLKSTRVLPSDGKELKVQLEFAKPVYIVDETILALPGKQSRWEIVVGEAKPQPSTEKLADAALTQIEVVRRDGRVDIVLTGSTGLTAEAAFLDQAKPTFVIDLPDVPVQQAESLASRFKSRAEGLIKSLKAQSVPGGSRLVFELTQSSDLIDTQGLIVGDQGQIVLSIVPDAKVDASEKAELADLGIEYGENQIQLRLMGIKGNKRVSAYTINDPQRLVVDFHGWKPEQVKSALDRFGAHSTLVVGEPLLDTTRLGSARAVFELAVPATFKSAKRVHLPVKSGSGSEENVLITLNSGPDAAETLARRAPDDLRFRRELQDGRQSEIVVKPTSLDGASRFDMAAMKPEQGKKFALIGFLEKSMQNDAKFKAARAEFEATSEVLPQARAGYMPTASFDYNRASFRQNVIKAPNPNFPTGLVNYPNTGMSLTITQPLFKPQAWIKMDQAHLAVRQAELNLVAAEQDLILRVATGYLNFLAANDGVDLAKAERDATEKQYDLAKSRLESGLGTIAQVQDMEARLRLSNAREIEAENRVDDARLALKEIIGEDVSVLKGFKADFTPSLPIPSSAEPWVEAAVEQNLALQGRGLAVEIAAMEISRQRAGHLPTVSLVGNASKQDAGGSLYGGGQLSENAEVGIRVSVPITDGGMTLSLSREAVARKEKAQQEQEQEYRRTERLTRSSFNGLVTSSKMVDALRQSVVAQESALETRVQGFKMGLYNVVAVMDAYRLYYTAQRDFYQARYDYLLNRLKLKQSVGTLSRNDLEAISALIE